MTTAVIGATGRVGREIVRGVLERGDAVAPLVRDPDKARRVFGEPGGLHIRPTRLDDPRDLAGAFQGIRTVGPRAQWPSSFTSTAPNLSDARASGGLRCMWRAIPVLLLLAAAVARADDDPPGTVRIELTVGRTAPIEALPGSRVICDDPSVVTPEFAEDGGGFVLRALKAGNTLCGVWLDARIGGLYRVRVAPRLPARGSSDAGAGVRGMQL